MRPASPQRRPRDVVVVDAPSNLGLRMPEPGVVPGCYKLAGALRDQGLVPRLGARDGGVVVPPRYLSLGWRPGDGVFNATAMAGYTLRLADRVDQLSSADTVLLVLGGDCSILLGPALALRRRGRYGLVFIDGHTDFRHLGNSPHVGAAAGEDLALVTGRGQPDLADLDGLAPYFRDEDVVLLGPHDEDDPTLAEARGLFPLVRTARELRATGIENAAAEALGRLDPAQLDGIWVHLDLDVLDPDCMPAVDSPDAGGLDFAELAGLLGVLLSDPRTVGMDVTVFDPDLDGTGVLAAAISDTLVTGVQVGLAKSSPGRGIRDYGGDA